MAKSTPSKSQQAPKSAQKKTSEQEEFERDLQALAAKAKEQTFSRWAIKQFQIIAYSAALLGVGAIYSNVSKLALSPVYGSIPSSIYHDKVIMTALFLGWSFNLYIKRSLPITPLQLLPVIAIWIPTVQFFLFQFSGSFGGRWGPVVIEATTLFPLLLFSVSYTASLLEDLELNTARRVAWATDAAPGITSFVYFKVIEYFSGNYISNTIGQTRVGLQIFLSAFYSLIAPSKLLLFTLPAVLHTAVFNYHFQSPYHTNYLNATLAKSNWTLLEREESITGYLSVIESFDKGFRVMRCDHSLLGGEWQRSVTKTPYTEPIYGIFVMLEAVRLIEVPEPVADKDAKALVIGLGIGTTPSALHAHGINTTIVEIDPAVHALAVKYFDFPPPPHINAQLTDAIAYASDLVKAGVEKYDYVVHDVFTGGAEPIDLFTVEFISDLKSLLKPNGVIAINYAGDLLLPSARIVIHTILSLFPPSHCRIFRESPPSTEKTSAAVNEKLDFTNMVIFCLNGETTSPSSSEAEGETTKSKSKSTTDSKPTNSKPNNDKNKEILTFRNPVHADFLNSGARQHFLLPRYEIPISTFGTLEELKEVGGVLYKDKARERFEKWHVESALGHWGVMRTVLPPRIWELW